MWTQRIMTSLPTDNMVLWPGAYRSGKLSFKGSFTHSVFFPVFFSAVFFFQAFQAYNIEVYGKTPKKLPYLEHAVFWKKTKTPWIQKSSQRWEKHHKKCTVVLSITPWPTANTWLWSFVPCFFITFSPKITLCITTIMENLKQGNWSILEKKTKNKNKKTTTNKRFCFKWTYM